MKYKEILEEEFLTGITENKITFVVEDVLGITTYDSELSHYFYMAIKATINSMITKTTFEFIEDPGHKIQYFTVINFPFMKGMIEYGTSPRGAWLNKSQVQAYMFLWTDIIVPAKEIEDFWRQLFEWAEENNT